MLCPVCQTHLTLVVWQGVCIDRCPACQGIWLDAGEVEQLAARIRPGDTRSRHDQQEIAGRPSRHARWLEAPKEGRHATASRRPHERSRVWQDEAEDWADLDDA